MGLTVRTTSRCGACLPTRPERAIRPHAGADRAGPRHVLSRRTGCGDRVEVRPVDAIEEP
ncbi:hypothetical protein GCM10023191_071600 [Actinoallomurus oryzae]|uniref:Uncharacterized protein n=1 Tax=Actinoallomurus oryzae TaxID=502180 RepID=A0ABP8QRX3_9ACTN